MCSYDVKCNVVMCDVVIYASPPLTNKTTDPTTPFPAFSLNIDVKDCLLSILTDCLNLPEN